MKELSIEEKAKRYDEAIERAKVVNKGTEDYNIVTTIFPELKESEDERMIKFISNELACLRASDEKGSDRYEELTNVIAWVEKQGEHANFLNKIQIGDKVTRNEDGVLVNLSQLNRVAKKDEKQSEQKPNPCENCSIATNNCQNFHCTIRDGEQKPAIETKLKIEEGKWYICISQFCNCIEGRVYKAKSDSRIMDDFGTEYDMHSDAYKYFRLWTIQDAKDGDVLAASDGSIFLFMCVVDCACKYHVALTIHNDIKINREVKGGYWETSRAVHPATQEQCDLLFQKMKEAGYEWDAEKKELKKINLIKAEHGKYYYCIKDYFSGGKKFSSKGDIVQALRGWPIMGLEDISEYFLPVDNIQKSTWSEEDEKIGKQLLNWFKGCNWDTIDNGTLKRDDIIAWLEERVQPQHKF